MYNLFCKDNNKPGENFDDYFKKSDIERHFSEDARISISESLDKIANKSLVTLKKEYPDILVFPPNFNEHNDDIHESVIFNKYSDDTIRTYNLMGFIGIDDVQLTIGSRFDKDENKQYFFQYMLQNVFAINMVNLDTTSGNENIWDFLLMFMFPYFLNNAIRQGIYKEYQKKKNNDFNVKGTIDIARHIKENIPFMGKVAYNTREFSFDNPTTQLIRHTAEFIVQKGFGQALNNTPETIENINIIRQATPSYNKRDWYKIISKNHNSVKHPFFTEYEPLRIICMRILRHEGVSLENDKNKVHGLLFDGAWLWEEYLDTILRNCGFKHPENKTKSGGLPLFEKSQPIYPDFYKENPNIVIDAKYKKLQDYKNLKTNDIYQVITYMYRLQAQRGILLYPTYNNRHVTDNMNKESYGSEGATFEKYGMAIPQDKNNFMDFVSEITTNEKNLKKELDICGQ